MWGGIRENNMPIDTGAIRQHEGKPRRPHPGVKVIEEVSQRCSAETGSVAARTPDMVAADR